MVRHAHVTRSNVTPHATSLVLRALLSSVSEQGSASWWPGSNHTTILFSVRRLESKVNLDVAFVNKRSAINFMELHATQGSISQKILVVTVARKAL